MKLTSRVFFMLIITASLFAKSNNITVNITSPKSGTRYQSCTDIKIQAETTIQTGTIDRVYFYADGKYIGFDRTSPYEFDWKNVPTGIYELTAQADTVVSDPITVFVDPVEDGDMIKNGEFVCRNWPWNLESREGAQASWEIIPYDRLSDTTAAEVQIETSTGIFWHVQFKQDVRLISGHTYEIKFMAEVENEKNIEVGLQQKEDPFDTYWSAEVRVSGILDTSFTWESDVTDPKTEFKFNVGDNTQTIVIDAVKLIDKDWEMPVVSIEENTLQQANRFDLDQNYPNPFNPTTNINYQLQVTNYVDLSIYNILAQKVAVLVSEKQSAGSYQVEWDATGFASGVYFYILQAGDFRDVRKMVLLQ